MLSHLTQLSEVVISYHMANSSAMSLTTYYTYRKRNIHISLFTLSFWLNISWNDSLYLVLKFIHIYTVKPAFAATSIWRPPVHGGHPEVPPMHFTIYFTSIWQPPAQRGQRPHFCAKKAKMNLLSRPQLFFSARYKEMSAIVKKKSRRSLS